MDDAKDLLQFLENSSIIDFTFIRQEYEKMNRQKILDQTKIWKATDGRWKAYVDVAGKRRLIAKSSRVALEDEIIETYKDPKIKFKECFDSWASEKLEYGEIQKSTYDRYQADYKRYIKDTELEYKEVKKIDELFLENFIKSTIASQHLTAKGWGNLRTLINGSMVYAHKHSYTEFRVSLFMAELQLSRKAFEQRVVNDEEQVFTRDEETRIEKYIADNPDMLSLGVALTFCTGLRVGEVAALKWSDYKGDFLSVTRTEIKYIGEHGERIADVRERTKGRDGRRQVVLNDMAIGILEKLKAYMGDSEWMFTRDGQRIKAVWLSLRITKLCKELGMPHRSFHKIRKTYATKLIDAGVPEKVVTKQMGHTEILTTKQFYYFNNEQVAEIKERLNKV
ncbi:MAG: site-specific integrase [Acetobacter sp.]|nr:site-specific integrase [Acetobacter sp.]MBO7732778.1 site-specific integrase [Methanobrevibacter sp.]